MSAKAASPPGFGARCRKCFLAVVNGAHQRFRMTRRFRLRDVIIERLEIIVRIVRQCAQPAERVGVEPPTRIFFAKCFEFRDGDFARVGQRFFVLRRLLQFAAWLRTRNARS